MCTTRCPECGEQKGILSGRIYKHGSQGSAFDYCPGSRAPITDEARAEVIANLYDAPDEEGDE